MSSIGFSPSPCQVAPGFTAETYRLMHPELGVPAVATSIDYMRDGKRGKAIGLVLQFPDGPRALLYGEISELEDALRPERKSTVKAGYSFVDANLELFS